MTVPARRTAVLVSKQARSHVDTYESPPAHRSPPPAGGLTLAERGDLILLWAGHGASVGSVQSPMAACMRHALRAEPRERPIRRLVTSELERHAGRRPVDTLVQTIADEGMATKHEVRLAIRKMTESGHLEQSVEDHPHKKTETVDGKDVTTTTILPTEMLRLIDKERQRFHEPLPDAERWARQDEEVREYCQGYMAIRESKSSGGYDRDMGIENMSLPAAKMPRLEPEVRVILERVYGTSYHPPYVDVFGSREVASVVEYTAILKEHQKRLAAASSRVPNPDEVLRSLLDEKPSEPVWVKHWNQQKKAFIDRSKLQAAKLLTEACEAFRAARWTT